jgi:hypothetical protein
MKKTYSVFFSLSVSLCSLLVKTERKTLILFIITSLICYSSIAGTCTAITGNWESASTWSCGHVPTCADLIIIPAGVTVTITAQEDYSACSGAITIYIGGTLTFTTGNKLRLPAGSGVIVQTGGSIVPGGGGGSSNLISIAGVDVWTAGSGTLNGPQVLGTGTLPIELINFSATPNNNNVVLDWSTATEINNNYFNIERSTDAINFTVINKINGAGNSTQIINYSAIDNAPLDGILYYRLKQTDFNGNYKFSNIVDVSFINQNEFSFEIFPNPNDGEIVNLKMSNRIDEQALVKVYSSNGKLIFDKNMILKSDGENICIINLSDKLSSGLYLLTITTSQNNYCKRFVVK